VTFALTLVAAATDWVGKREIPVQMGSHTSWGATESASEKAIASVVPRASMDQGFGIFYGAAR
jgi:hypothetical protein